MIKRVFAWVLLIGFFALLANIIYFHYFLEVSFGVYIAVAALFLIFINRKK